MNLNQIFRLVFLILAVQQLVIQTLAQRCDSRCQTGDCDTDGHCICDSPQPGSTLQGDRAYFGGEYCDEEFIMCDGTDDFWCQNNSTCVEVVQGEEYKCNCPLGYAGDHCELKGIPCKDMYCFHGAECIGDIERPCDCPPEWQGSSNCALSTQKATPGDVPGSVSSPSGHNSPQWSFVGLGTGVGVLLAVIILVIVILRRKKRSNRDKYSEMTPLHHVGDSFDVNDEL